MDAQDDKGSTPLMRAAVAGRIDNMRALVVSGADVDLSDAQGRIAIYWACAKGNGEAVKLLLGAGADAYTRARERISLAMVAMQAKSVECMRMCLPPMDLRQGDELMPNFFMEYAVRCDAPDCLSALIEMEEPLRGQVNTAASMGRAECLRVLLEAGGDPNERHHSGASPALCAVMANHVDCFVLLAESGARMDYEDRDGSTLADMAKKRSPDCLAFMAALADRKALMFSLGDERRPAVRMAQMRM